MITFSSSTFSGTESSGVISATVIISGGIVSSRNINVPIRFSAGTATGIFSVCIYHRPSGQAYICNCTYLVTWSPHIIWVISKILHLYIVAFCNFIYCFVSFINIVLSLVCT